MMKSTYKLYGTFWDQMEISETVHYVEDIELIPLGKMIIKLSDVMSDEECDVLETDAKEVSLIVDFIPANDSVVIWDFYLKRMLQIAEYYHSEIACLNSEYAIHINNALRDFYKRKTPQRLLAQSDGVSQVIC